MKMKLRDAALATAIGIATLAGAPAALVAQGPPPPPPGYGSEPWAQPPSEYQEVQRQGFRDGIEGARKDFENHRRPDVNNRDEYRHPHAPPHEKQAYRDGFYRGYQVGVQHLMNGGI
jgi:hypothetical protein